MSEPEEERRRFAWWHELQPMTRRAVRVGVAFVLSAVAALGFAVSTASYEGAVGPHVAEYSTRLNGEIRVDMGPLGALVIDSPLPLRLGVDVLVREIPDQLSVEDADPIAGLTSDLNSYSQFLANPQATIDDATRGLLTDVLGRWVVTWCVLLMVIALGRLAAHGVLREAAKSSFRQPGVPVVAGALAVVLVVLPLSDLTRSFGSEGRSSPVLAGTALADARITGRLATIIDHYGGFVVDAVEENSRFYADVEQNLIDAYARNPVPLAPPERLPVPEDPDEEDDTDDISEDEGTDGDGTDGDGEGSDGGGTGDSADDEGTDGDGADGEGTDGDGGEDAGTAGAQIGEGQPGDEGDEGDSGQDDGAQDDVTGEQGEEAADGPVIVRSEPDHDYATMLVVSDLHCNVGMADVIGTAADLAEADMILNAGDTVVSGTSVESYCINAFADGIGSGIPVIVADGNHDSVITAEQERARGWTVLSGEVVEVEGVRILGDTDPTLTEIGTGTRPERDETVMQMGARLTEQACELADAGNPVDILMVHSPYAGRQVLNAGCAPLNISGHLHRQMGPLQWGLGVHYVSGSTAGAAHGQPTIGPLQSQAAMTVIRWDRTTGLPAHYRLIHIEPDSSVSLSLWLPFPDQPTEFVHTDGEEATDPPGEDTGEGGEPTDPDGTDPDGTDPDGTGEDAEGDSTSEGDPGTGDQNLDEDEAALDRTDPPEPGSEE